MKLVLHRAASRETPPILLILLPGMGMNADDFITHGFISAIRQESPAIDTLVVEPNLDSYLDTTITRQLVTLIAEHRGGLHARIWIGGISLGCFGALLAASASPEMIDGVILLSPYLGSPGFIAEIKRNGGLLTWNPGLIASNDGERRIAAWFKSHIGSGRQRPSIHLAYGNSDRFAPAASLLASELPSRQCRVVDGGHDWPTWIRLWECILAVHPFSVS